MNPAPTSPERPASAPPAPAARPTPGRRAARRLAAASALTAGVGAVALDGLLTGPDARATLTLPVDRLALRMLLLALVGLCAVLTTGGLLGVIGAGCRSARAWRGAERLTVGLAGRVASLTVIASLATAVHPPPVPAGDGAVPVMRLLDEAGEPPSTGRPDDPVLRLLDDGAGAARDAALGPVTDPGIGHGIGHVGGPGFVPAAETEAVDAVAWSGTQPGSVGSDPRLRHVESGDNLWSIAEEVMTARGGDPDVRTIADYWLRLIERNRHNLADPDNPDLLFRGQWLDLPSP